LFLLLAFLCYEGHQLVRHLTGAALCGGFGTMTFTVAATKQPCSLPTVVTLSGPVFTYGLAWLGMLLLRSPRHALFAYALVFASWAPVRFIQTLTGRGDERVLAEQWFGVTSQVAVAAIVFLIGLPPAVAAFRAIANRRRVPVFIASLPLPLPLLFVLLLANRALFGESGTDIQGATVLGMSLLVLILDLIAAVLFVALARLQLF
jgi:hypothetical protein